jgi:hypothetical protein
MLATTPQVESYEATGLSLRAAPHQGLDSTPALSNGPGISGAEGHRRLRWTSRGWCQTVQRKLECSPSTSDCMPSSYRALIEHKQAEALQESAIQGEVRRTYAGPANPLRGPPLLIE